MKNEAPSNIILVQPMEMAKNPKPGTSQAEDARCIPREEVNIAGFSSTLNILEILLHNLTDI